MALVATQSASAQCVGTTSQTPVPERTTASFYGVGGSSSRVTYESGGNGP